jgi:hypothetical protein
MADEITEEVSQTITDALVREDLKGTGFQSPAFPVVKR